MRRRLYMIKALLALLLAFPACTAFAQLTAGERAFIADCAANVDKAKKLYDPAAAEKVRRGA